MKIVSNKELSFGAMLDSGATKEQLMKRFALTERQYDAVIRDLRRIRTEAMKK